MVDATTSLVGVQPSVAEGAANQTVTVTAAYAERASKSSATTVTVSVAAAAGPYGAEANDFTAVNDFTVTIPANAASGSATFSLTTASDDLVEGPEDIAVTGTAAGHTVNGAFVIIDDDADTVPTVNLSVDTQTDTGEQNYVVEGNTRTVAVKASVPTGAAALTSSTTFTVSLAADTAEAGDFTAPATVDVTIPANSRSGTATISFAAASDTALEGLETVSLTSSLSGYVVNPASITIRDQDSQFQLRIDKTSVDENAGPTSITLTVRFPHAATSELTSETGVARGRGYGGNRLREHHRLHGAGGGRGHTGFQDGHPHPPPTTPYTRCPPNRSSSWLRCSGRRSAPGSPSPTTTPPPPPST